jgi:hypothetical protein
MLRVRMHARLLILAACVTLAALLLTLVPTFAVHAVSGFTPQTRMGFPAGDDWETALARAISGPRITSTGRLK